MAGRGGRGEALRKLLAAERETQESQCLPRTEEVVEMRRSLGRGALFAKTMTEVQEASPRIIPPEAPIPSSPQPVPTMGRGRAALFNIIAKADEEEQKSARGRASLGITSPRFLLEESDSSGSSSTPPRSPRGIPLLGNEGRSGSYSNGSHSNGDALTSGKFGDLSLKEQYLPTNQRGTTGTKVNVTCNYVRLRLEPEKGVYEYEVKFKPDIESRQTRFVLLSAHESVIGPTRTFDGTILYLPVKLPRDVTHLKGNLPSDSSEVDLTIIFKRRKVLGETIHLYNVLFRRIMNILGLTLLGRHFFDPSGSHLMPKHRLEIWPGYITAVDEYEGGIMLCCDSSHRILRNQTAYDLLTDIMSVNPNHWREDFTRAMMGQSVLTRYNNKLYVVDDVLFNSNPLCKFSAKEGQEISYVDYYAKQYCLKIKDLRQPLLISKRKGRIKGKVMQDLVSLIPELCHLTGLTDALKSDIKLMKDVSQCMRITPQQRYYALKKFIENVNSTPKAKSLLESWGLTLEAGVVQLDGRELPREEIYFGDNKNCLTSFQAEWARAASTNAVLSAVDLNNWFVVCTLRDEKYVRDFLEMLKKCGPQIGMAIGVPKIVQLRDDGTDKYVQSIRNGIYRDCQLVVIVFPVARSDKYSAVKKLCCSEIGIASQVIQTRTIRRIDKLRSVSQKIALQINCKLGGTLWSVKIPLRNTMVCGIDTYHDPSGRGSSVAALVSSLNPTLSRWYSRISKQARGNELTDGLATTLLGALTKYCEVNGSFPEQLLIFRDGVGDGQLSHCQKFECPQIQACFRRVNPDYQPKFLMVVVQKRINTRIYLNVDNGGHENPPPGTVVDYGVTRKDWYDFFLVSQNVRQGTVSPTHYVVIHNSTRLNPDQVQRLSYKLTHLYYNWPGTIRVPAPCQYAHKLAYLVGENTAKEACDKLCDKLYYL